MTNSPVDQPAALVDRELFEAVCDQLRAALPDRTFISNPGLAIPDMDGSERGDLPSGVVSLPVTADPQTHAALVEAAVSKLAAHVRRRVKVPNLHVRRIDAPGIDWEAPPPPEGYPSFVMVAAEPRRQLW